ncbi:Sybindin-like family protein [Theileria parva strain Muguga]|uniref:Sybindin-like family protein n=1 Tax=Theileria parva strain Muguga TaxID=333668 RepID=UPI001C61ADEF|nr:Sybindin-like family protein [Theileria parva strain Muguga]KAF5153432.1 Sybindin-like family protein [Theileria parva strain Muguga]
MVEIYSFYIFYRVKLIYSNLYNNNVKNAIENLTHSTTSHNSSDVDGYKTYEKLLIGFLNGLKSFSKTICEINEINNFKGISTSYFNTCTTHEYKIHYFETITGYKLVCLTSCDVPSLEDTLKFIYTEILTNLIIVNPTYIVGSTIESTDFDKLIKKSLSTNI